MSFSVQSNLDQWAPVLGCVTPRDKISTSRCPVLGICAWVALPETSIGVDCWCSFGYKFWQLWCTLIFSIGICINLEITSAMFLSKTSSLLLQRATSADLESTECSMVLTSVFKLMIACWTRSQNLSSNLTTVSSCKFNRSYTIFETWSISESNLLIAWLTNHDHWWFGWKLTFSV